MIDILIEQSRFEHVTELRKDSSTNSYGDICFSLSQGQFCSIKICINSLHPLTALFCIEEFEQWT